MMSLGYLAGFFDGEGSVGIYGSTRYNLRVCINQVVNSDSTVLFDELVKNFGGALYYPKRTRLHHKQAVSWTAYGEAAMPFLIAIRPYLRLKMRQVDIVTAWQSAYPSNRGTRDPTRALQRKIDAEKAIMELSSMRSKGPERT